MEIPIDVWVVRDKDSGESVVYLKEEDARNSTVFENVGLLYKTVTTVNIETLKYLESGNYINQS